MKTAVSVPDALFEQAEKLARRMRKSRSQLYSDALREYTARHEPATITAALDALYEGDSGPDAFVRESARRTLRPREGWEDQFRRMVDRGDDRPLWPEAALTSFDEKEWEW